MQRKTKQSSTLLPLQSQSPVSDTKDNHHQRGSNIGHYTKKQEKSGAFYWLQKSKLLLARLFHNNKRQWRLLLLLIAATLLIIVVYSLLRQVISGSHDTATPQVFRDQTIQIPMENIPEGMEPIGLPLRFLDNLKLRKTGNDAILQYAQDIRNLISFGGDYLLLKMMGEKSSESNSSSKDPQREALFWKRLSEMAPWLRLLPNGSSSSELLFSVPSVPGKAILICAGNKQMKYIETLLYTIRTIHKSQMPIYISFRGDQDLAPHHREKLTSQFAPAIHTLDLTQHFDLDKAQLHAGWNLRMFGALLVPETEIVMLDADVLLFRPPEDLFQMQGYQEAGVLFFHDRMCQEWVWTPRQFFHRVQPFPSQRLFRALNNGQMNNEHIIESGVVLINKSSRRLLGIWTACLLLGRWDLRRFAQANYVFGDKEFYMAAMELIQEPYAMSRYYPGVTGNVFTDFQKADVELDEADSNNQIIINEEESNNNNQFASQMALCGRLLHFDDSGMPLWSNGGYLTKADDFESEQQSISKGGLRPFYFIDGGDSWTEHGQPVLEHQLGLNQNWKFNFKMGVNCLFPNARKVRHVPSEDVSHGVDAVQYYITNADSNK